MTAFDHLLLETGDALLLEDGDYLLLDPILTRFLGRISAIRPDSGLFDSQIAEVDAHDWMGLLAEQRMGTHEVAADMTADEAIVDVLPDAPLQPADTDLDVGDETFPTMYDTDGPGTSLASFFQKLARNEWGRIYGLGDGALRFENQSRRAGLTSVDLTLDGAMNEFQVDYSRADIWPIVQVIVSLATIDAAADRLLWSLAGAPGIGAGETLEITCPYTDVEGTNQKIAAKDIVDPPFFEFGSVPNFVSDDMHADLTVVLDVGASRTVARLTNTAGSTGYLNDLQIEGKGIIFASPMTIERSNVEPIYRGVGERILVVRLDQIADLDTATARAEALLAIVGDPGRRPVNLEFLANQTDALAEAALALEVSSRVDIIESLTGISGEYFVERLGFRLEAGQLWVKLLASPA